jgi:hypothetical protein
LQLGVFFRESVPFWGIGLDTTSKNQQQPASLFLLVGLKPSHSNIPNQQTEKTSKSGSLYRLFIGFSIGSIFIFFFSFSLKGKGFTGLLVLLVLAF